MAPEMLDAIDKLELIESLGVHIPAKSRDAITTAILFGCYNGCGAVGFVIEFGDIVPTDTAIVEEMQELKPVFGL